MSTLPLRRPDARAPGRGRGVAVALALVVDAVALGVLVGVGPALSARTVAIGGVAVLGAVVGLAELLERARRRAALGEHPSEPLPRWAGGVLVILLAGASVAGAWMLVTGASVAVELFVAGVFAALAVGTAAVGRVVQHPPLWMVHVRERVHAAQPLPQFGRGTATMFLVALAVDAVAVGVIFGAAPQISGKAAMLGVAMVAAALVAMFAATRFWQMLVLLFVARASLDAFKPGGATTFNGIDPTTLVGGVFLLSAVIWLLAQREAGVMPRLSRTSLAFSAFAAACVLSSFGARDLLDSFQQSSKVVSSAVMLVVLEVVFAQRPNRIRPLLVAVFASLAVPAAVAVTQLLGPAPQVGFGQPDISRVHGTFVHPNAFATYLVTVALVAVAIRPHLTPRVRLATNAVAFASTALLLFTYARGAWGAFLVGLLVVGILQDRRIIGVLLVAVVAVAITVPSVASRLGDLGSSQKVQGVNDPNSLAWRVGYWQRVLPYAKEDPVTGIGLGMVEKTSPEGMPPHNVFVQAFIETGVVGLGALLFLVVTMWRELRRALRRASPGFERGVVVGATAAAVALLMQFASENLITQVVSHWYLLVPVAWALALLARPQGDDGEGDAAAAEARPALDVPR